jgi:hypothetical protein
MGRAMRFGQRALGVAARRADELQAQRLGPLAGDQAHPAGGGMEQHKVALFAGPALRLGARSRYCAVRPLSIMAAPVSKLMASGSLHTQLGRHHPQLAVAPGGLLA